jgi:hypothetical protein
MVIGLHNIIYIFIISILIAVLDSLAAKTGLCYLPHDEKKYSAD